MFNHKPKEYICPFCLSVQGVENGQVYTKQDDIIFTDAYVMAFIASHWYPRNPGHVIIIPQEHIENLYDMPNALLCRVHALSKRVAVAMRETYSCSGITIRQNNEPTGNQCIWHYHVHVYPRYQGDGLFTEGNVLSNPEERRGYALRLREYFKNLG